MKKNIWKLLAAAGSFVILAGSRTVMTPYANVDPGGGEFIVSGPEQCRRLLMELVSMSETGERKEWYLTGEDYEPETLVIAQMFPDAVNISNTVVREYQKNGAINEWVENWLESDDYDGTEDSSVDIEGGAKSGRGKLIIFGHHKEFISAIEENL